MNDRNRLLGAVHRAAKLAGLDENTYRDMLERLTGKRSAKNCSDAELSLVLNNFHVKHPRAEHSHHTKIKALFIAAYNLGLFESGTDAALDAFVSRQTGKLRLSFVTPTEAAAAVEALKAMLARKGFIVPSTNDRGMTARRELLKAQWAELYRIGATATDYPSALWHYAGRVLGINCSGLEQLDARQLDTVARRLGGWIKQRKAARSAAA